MIESLIVDNFRSFSRFEMHQLGRVNLLVGMNNTGKTSLLEAIQVVASGADPQDLWSIANRRGEFFIDDAETGYRRATEIDISHWFHDFRFDLGNYLRLTTLDGDLRKSCELSIVDAPVEAQRTLFSNPSQTTPPPPGMSVETGVENEDFLPTQLLALQVSLSDAEAADRIHLLTGRGGLSLDAMRKRNAAKGTHDVRVVFVPTAGLSTQSLVAIVDDLALTENEDLALQAMQTLDKRIERFAAKGREVRPRIMVRLKGINKPLPIGILGDGVNRLLTIAVALAKSAGGILLVDEIDTGLHFTAMDRMWQFVSQAAEKLNVQVFATTHSRDCYESLAGICTENSGTLSKVSIQRIEKDRTRSVSYSESEIVAAARRGLEVR